MKPALPWRGYLAALIVAGVLAWSVIGTGFDLAKLFQAGPQVLLFFTQMVPTADHPWTTEILPEIGKRLLETLRIAVAATICGAALALPFPMVGARTMAAGKLVYAFGRGYLNLIRTIPDLVLAALIAVAFGYNSFSGFIALLIFSFGVVAKLLCDTAETIDPGPMEAIASVGGTRLQRALYGVFPQIAPDFAAYTLYAFEINIRAASVLGLVGAGGIGMILQKYTAFGNYNKLGLIILIIFALVMLIDGVSTALRRKLV